MLLRVDVARELLRIPRGSLRSIQERVDSARFVAGAAVLADGLLVLCDVDAFLDEAEALAYDDALARASAPP